MGKEASEALMSIYVSKEIHKKVKLYCIKNDIGSIRDFAEKVLALAVEKPKASERLEIARLEALEAGAMIEEEKPVTVRKIEGGAPIPIVIS